MIRVRITLPPIAKASGRSGKCQQDKGLMVSVAAVLSRPRRAHDGGGSKGEYATPGWYEIADKEKPETRKNLCRGSEKSNPLLATTALSTNLF